MTRTNATNMSSCVAQSCGKSLWSARRYTVSMLFVMMVFPSYADNLICLGDSQTAVRPPVQAEDTYCHKMAIATGRTALNKAVGGRLSTEVLANLSSDALTQQGSCVTVMLGAGDSFLDYANDNPAIFDYSSYWTQAQVGRVSVSQFKANLTSIVQQLRAAGKNVTLLTSWQFASTLYLTQSQFYADVVKGVGAELGVPVLDAAAIFLHRYWGSSQWLDGRVTPPISAPSILSFLVDWQHQSALGHTYIANLCQKPQAVGACACNP